MSAERFPVAWADRVAVVAMPAEIDMNNAEAVHDQLLAVMAEGAVTVIVDMTVTTFCDSAGVNALVQARKRALAGERVIQIAAIGPAVIRLLSITGVDKLIDVYPTVSASLTGPSQPEPAP
jgi:anti-sigma B factor antagonist